MDYRRLHWLEKLQVQLVSLVALGAGYFLLFPAVRPSDPTGAVAFLPTGGLGQLVLFAGGVLLLAAVVTLATVNARPASGLLVALIGAGGVSLRSEGLRELLWYREESIAELFGLMAGELLLLTVVMLLAAAVVALVRRTVAARRPDWMWQDPREEKHETEVQRLPRWFSADLGLVSLLSGDEREESGAATRTERRERKELFTQAGAFAATALVVGLLLAMIVTRAPLRGQVIFGVFVSFTLSVLIGHQAFPTPRLGPVWLLPMAAGLAVYALGIIWASPGQWYSVPPQAQALPVDWMAAGGGGSLLGYWISTRVHELRHFEQTEKQEIKGA